MLEIKPATSCPVLKQTDHLTDRLSGKRLLGRHKLIREDNIRVDLKGIRINMTNWVVSAQDSDYFRALVNPSLNLWVPKAMELVSYIYPNERRCYIKN